MERLAVIISLVFMGFSSAHASFDDDLASFRNALDQASLSSENLPFYLNPYNGSSRFFLPEETAPWAGNYFPLEKGGLAMRWQSKGHAGNNLYSSSQLQNMSVQEIRKKLSPVEKYDLYMGDANFSATQFELQNRGPLRSFKPQDWEGFCNGVRCAAINLPEPQRSIEVKNAEGVTIIFEPSDLKALAGAAYNYVELYSGLGSPSRAGKAENQPNAAVFDLALRYYLAESSRSFLIDNNLGPEIWNNAVVGYSRRAGNQEKLSSQERKQYPNATRRILVETNIYYLGETEIKRSNQKTKDAVAAELLHETLPVSYFLYVDINDNVVDGQWRPGLDPLKGVDFAWFGAGRGTDAFDPKGNPFLDFKKIEKLVKKAAKPGSCRSLL